MGSLEVEIEDDGAAVWVIWADDRGSRNYDTTRSSSVLGADYRVCGVRILKNELPESIAQLLREEG